MNELLNHLWQSTVFAAAVALACAAMRDNSPRLRYWLWLAASLKFLIPFALFVSVGARVKFPPDTPSLHAITVQGISTSFAPVSVIPASGAAHSTVAWPELLGGIWLAGTLFLLIRWLRRWRTVHAAAHGAARLPLGHRVPIFSSRSMLEPGVFGIFRPVILLPEGIADGLTPEQFEAMLIHEYRHIECRDNLTAALHMGVETLFWFHPMVWWIGAKLMDERERDCDEAVLRQGSVPGDYARSLVRVCETYVESPLPCASGISGSDLKKRIREIMTWSGSLPVTPRAKVMLAVASLAVMSVPFAICILRAQTLPPPPAYTYEVVSIHRSDPADRGSHISDGPQGGLRTTNTSVLKLISVAYKVEQFRIIGAPRWVETEHFDVTFTPDKAQPTPADDALPGAWDGFFNPNLQRLQAVLRDRFGLVLRAETRELPIYGLTQGKGGIKMAPQPEGTPGATSDTDGLDNGDYQIRGRNATMETLAGQLSVELKRPVHDETGLKGRYNYKFEYAPERDETAGVQSSAPGASIFTAITQQLGLRLESKKGPVQVYVVEKVERPAEN